MSPITITRALACASVILYSANVFAGDTSTESTTDSKKTSSAIEDAQPVSTDIFSLESSYTARSNVKNLFSLGKQDMLYSEFSYNHRFHVNGNWYVRAGIDYTRFDFSGPVTGPLPKRLQALSGLVALEYVVHDFAAVSFEIRPGFAYENDIRADTFDIPFDIYTSFPIVKDKVFGMAGVFYGANFKPEISPIGGIIWLINDKTRLEAIFPQAALVYSYSDNLELRATADVGGYGFRMDNNGRTAKTYADARLQYDYTEIGVQATYKGWKPFDVSIGGGYDIEREFEFVHSGPFQKYKTAGAPYIKISFGAKF